MAKATKAQRDYFEALAQKATTEEKALALKVAKDELEITDEWSAVTAEKLENFRWEKHEISILIDVLKNPEYYTEPETEEEAELAVMRIEYPESQELAEATADDIADSKARRELSKKLTPEQKRRLLELTVNRDGKYMMKCYKQDRIMNHYQYPAAVKEAIEKAAKERAIWHFNHFDNLGGSDEYAISLLDWNEFWRRVKLQGPINSLEALEALPANIIKAAVAHSMRNSAPM